MSQYTSYYTSSDLIEAVKRKISFPVSEETFSETDILAFATEELMLSQVPSVMEYHEEYFVYTQTVPLKANKTKYPIPSRAIGMKLRDLFFKDSNGNLFDMVRVAQDDRAFFQKNEFGTELVLTKYYLQGNDVILTSNNVSSPTGSLFYVYFLRPNRLVLNTRAAICTNFLKNIVVDNTALVVGDTLTIDDSTFTAVASSPGANQFVIGTTSITTATNISIAINNAGVVNSASNGTPSTSTIVISYNDLEMVFSTINSVAFTVETAKQQVQFDTIPSNIQAGLTIDFLQTKSGHKSKAIDVMVPTNSISNNIVSFLSDSVPQDFIVGDYICLSEESIIPQIPTDLHTGLAERTCARILAAIGDQAGLQASNLKIAEIEKAQGPLLNSRVEGSNQKVTNRRSLLSMGKMGIRRIF